MRAITYGGEQMITTDDVAEVLIVLAAAIAACRDADAVWFPVVPRGGEGRGDVHLVIGVGNDIMSSPTPWEGGEPDFSEAARDLRAHRHYPRWEHAHPTGSATPEQRPWWDFDHIGWE